ncbi:MAG: RIP metalloprotease RseP [Bacteroidales bacterium]|nr:RIP metalloprotease RseP [Bacteroidales bacterium]
MDIFIKIAQLLLSLSILVVFHEFGHFLAAKAFKTRVEKFYLFFNPWFSLFKFKFKDTEYGMGWLPLGGYVKISGMIDESMDREAMKKEPQSWEFRSKPALQRLIIMIGGVTVNVLLAFVIYIGILAVWGEQYLPTSQVNKYGIVADSLASEMGLQNGDRILSVNQQVVNDFNKIPMILILEEAKTIRVERDGQILDLAIPQGILGKLVKHKDPNFLSPRFPFEVEGFSNQSTAKDAGIEVQDKIISINGEPTNYFDEFARSVKSHKGETVQAVVVRGNDTLLFSMQVSTEGLVGIYTNPTKYFEFEEKNYNLFQAIPAGFVKTYDGIGNYLKQLKLLFSPEVKAYESVGGFITIGSIFPPTWDWPAFWRLTAFLSIMLAILNLLPIPALDGGHVMFLAYEIISGRKPSDKFMEYAQIAGMVLLFGLLIFANGNDIVKLFNK